jgi:hypothetical protein
MLARAPPWLSAMQKVIAAFVDSNQTPPMELTPWSTCWAQAMQSRVEQARYRSTSNARPLPC